MLPIEIVKHAGNDNVVDLKTAVFSNLQQKINDLIAAKRFEVVSTMFTKENYDQGKNGYQANTPDEKTILDKLLKNITKHDYPVENKDDLPFKALNTHPTGPAGDHKPAPKVEI